MTTSFIVSKLTITTFANAAKAQVSILSNLAIESAILLKTENFKFSDYAKQLELDTGYSLKSIQNFLSVVKKLQDKHLPIIESKTLSRDGIDSLASWIQSELSKGAYTNSLDDVNNWLAGKPSTKAAAAAAKAAAEAQAKAAAEAAAAPKAEAAAEAAAAEAAAAPKAEAAPAPLDPFTAIYNELKKLTLTKEQWVELSTLCLDQAGIEVDTADIAEIKQLAA